MDGKARQKRTLGGGARGGAGGNRTVGYSALSGGMVRAVPPRTRPHGRPAAGPLMVQQSDGGIAVITVAADGLPAEQHAQLYTLTINGLLDTRTLTPEPRGILHGLHLEPLHITFGDLSPRVSRRTRALAARDRFDGIALQLVRAGRWHGRVGGRAVGGEAGTMMLFDFTQSFTVTDEIDRSFVNVIIPRPLAARLADDPATLHGRALDALAGGALGGFLTGLVAQAAALRAEQAPALAEVVMALATLAFRAEGDRRTPERRGPERRLRDRVERLVGQRLSAEDLSPDWIARKLGVSRTELYAAFDGGGGIARLVWDRRLAAARAALLDPFEARTIGAIAHLFGFTSDAHPERGAAGGAGRETACIRRSVKRNGRPVKYLRHRGR
jgi:AraC-like DNA-binding protein